MRAAQHLQGEGLLVIRRQCLEGFQQLNWHAHSYNQAIVFGKSNQGLAELTTFRNRTPSHCGLAGGQAHDCFRLARVFT